MAKKDKFDYFKSYKRLAEIAVEESELLVETLKDFTEASALSHTLEEVHELEREGDQINHHIYENTAGDFMPPFDREDVIELAGALDDVLDDIFDVIKHIYMYDIRTMPKDAITFGELIRDSCKDVLKAMGDFKSFKKSKKFKELLVDINDNEEKGDQLYLEVNRTLHTKDNDSFMHILVWSRIYERMEKCCDACEHVANVMNTIMLKNM